MKSLKPLTIIVVGPMLLAVAFPAGTWVVLPSARHLVGMAWACLIGAVGGLVFFGPMAAVIWLKTRFREWFERNFYRLQWHTSMAMGVALGYWIACSVDNAGGNLLMPATVILILGASVKVGLSNTVRSNRSLSSAEQSGER
jgi:hypothetical protein